MTRASGVGSWPDQPVRDVVRRVRDTLADGGIPYVPELPGRGPGADMVGRTAGLLVEMPVDLQPSGWRLTDAPGRDVGRAASYLREDLDEVAEAYDGYSGPLKLQVCGPWTLAASLWLPRGDRAVVDAGAARDLADSLAEGVRELVGRVHRLVPGAALVVQLDEPSLPTVLTGRLRSASGFGRLRAVDPGVVEAGLRTVVEAVGEDADVVVHCCAPDVPFALLRRLGSVGIAIDTTLLTPRTWESVAASVESGTPLWAGLVPTGTTASHPREVVDPFVRGWHEVGLEDRLLADVVVTPACGLGTRTPQHAAAVQRLAVEAAAAVSELL
ncbi:uroporphyrinogen decarboxylase/cobalamine-independent methonine synthase family protein [Luteipulveratus halotolerans]|uniref:Methionine synthase n=1 Tax=Luteipulveratus halotolerans TaxID=1631356 RepID=A0A0L6CFR2_9MICO|nr:methionine synthase [Luteipulveratus halotolerans]KNX36661.1 methionine synthase [Luteipulveratus halotolerans]